MIPQGWWEVRHKTKGWIAASGFWGRERAEQWLAKFDPRMWTDKTLTADSFEIVQEAKR